MLGAPSHSYSTMPPHLASAGQLAPELVSPSVKVDDSAITGDPCPAVSPQSYDEPIVTRKELWSYYCVYYSSPSGRP